MSLCVACKQKHSHVCANRKRVSAPLNQRSDFKVCAIALLFPSVYQSVWSRLPAPSTVVMSSSGILNKFWLASMFYDIIANEFKANERKNKQRRRRDSGVPTIHLLAFHFPLHVTPVNGWTPTVSGLGGLRSGAASMLTSSCPQNSERGRGELERVGRWRWRDIHKWKVTMVINPIKVQTVALSLSLSPARAHTVTVDFHYFFTHLSLPFLLLFFDRNLNSHFRGHS